MITKPNSKVFYLAADNSAQCVDVTIETAWLSNRPFFIEVDDSVIAVDYDDEYNCNSQQYKFRSYVNNLLKRDPVTCNSGRGVHQFLRLSPSEMHLKEDLIHMARWNGGDVRKTIRPPLSPHRRGLPVSFYMNYETPLSAIERLGGVDSLPMVNMLEHIPPALMDRISGAFVHIDRSREIIEVMSELYREGVSEAVIYKLFRHSNMPICDKLLEKADKDREKYVETQLKQAKRHARLCGQHTITVDNSIYAEIEDYVRSEMQFPDRSGPYKRDILLAMIFFARKCGNRIFHASVRDLCLVSEIATAGAVLRNIDQMVKDGLVERVHPGRYRQAAKYRILIQATTRTHSSGGVSKNVISRSTRISSQVIPDLFRSTRRRGVRTMGKTAGLVLDWIRAAAGPETPRELGQRMGRPVANLRRYIQMLDTVGLIDVGIDGRIRSRDVATETMREIKRNLGCLDLREVYERRVRRQRQEWRVVVLTALSGKLGSGDRTKLRAAVDRHRTQYLNYMKAAA